MSAGAPFENASPYTRRSSGPATATYGIATASVTATSARLNDPYVRCAWRRSRPYSPDSTGSAPANIAPGASRATVPQRDAAAKMPTSAGVAR
ncbi:MAG: hypothetical protein DMG03_19140 [Acidobacteria bacterium]|nr:MAG: hypothetical protein DMG03_19140 [Acidobacteriota bacterium]